MIYLWVFLGSALGGMARYFVSNVVALRTGTLFPWGTIIINISGSFLIVFFGTLATQHGILPASPAIRTFVTVGFCGGYTTVSSFALQTFDLARRAKRLWAATNVLISIVFCLSAAWLGFAAGMAINHAGRG